MIKKNFIYKYNVHHREPIHRYVQFQFEEYITDLVYRIQKPIKCAEQFCFIVGCGHSGTTLVASKLGNHPDVLTIGRESRIFNTRREKWAAHYILKEWLFFAKQQGASCIVEKTPKHVHRSRAIERTIDSAKFLLVVRNPLDNVASLYKRFENLEYSIERWNIDNGEVARLARKENCIIVKYEDFTLHTESELKRISDFLNLNWSDDFQQSESSSFSVENLKENMKIRAEQVRRPISPNIDSWKSSFDLEMASKILSDTLVVSNDLGYDSVLQVD